MNNYYKLIILVLLLVAVSLGIAVYQKKVTTKPNPQNSNQPQEQQQEQQKEVKLSDPEYDKDLTEVQKKLFYNPPSDASEETKKQYFDFAVSLAKPGNIISIDECKASPDVISIKLGDKLTVKNIGKTDIRFGLEANNKITIKAGASANVNKDMFKQGQGLYGYGCENPGVRRAIGMILVTP